MAWWCAGNVPLESGCIHPRPPADTAGRGFQVALSVENALKYQQAEEFGNHRFPHRAAQCALTVCPSGAGSGALPAA